MLFVTFSRIVKGMVRACMTEVVGGGMRDDYIKVIL